MTANKENKIFKIIVVSDSHGEKEKIQRVINENQPFDVIIHCGDGTKDMREVITPENTILNRVKGNMDMYNAYDVDDEIMEFYGNKFIFITHGNKYNVKENLHELTKEGKNRNADIILFGHTHIPYLKEGHPTLFNPGAILEDSYGIITVAHNNEWRFSHHKHKHSN